MLYNNATSIGQDSFISLCAKGSANFLVISPEEQLILDSIPGWQKETNQDINVAISHGLTTISNSVTASTLNSKQTAVVGSQTNVLCSSSTVLQSTLKQNGMFAAKKRKNMSLCEPLSIILPDTDLRLDSEVAFPKKRCTQLRLLSLSFNCTNRGRDNICKKTALRHFHSMPDLHNLSNYKNNDFSTYQNVNQLLVKCTQNMKDVQESVVKEDFRLKSMHDCPLTQPEKLEQKETQKVSAIFTDTLPSAKHCGLKQHNLVDITPCSVSLLTQNKTDENLPMTEEISDKVYSMSQKSISNQPINHSQLLIPVNIDNISKRTDVSPKISHQAFKIDPSVQSSAFPVNLTDSSNSISSSLPCGQVVNEKTDILLPFSQKENTCSQQVIPGTPIVIRVTPSVENEKDMSIKKDVLELNSMNPKPNFNNLISPEKLRNEKLEVYEMQHSHAMGTHESPLKIVRKKLFQSLPQPEKEMQTLDSLPCTSKTKVVAWQKKNEHYVQKRKFSNQDCSSLKLPSLVTDISVNQESVTVDKKQDFQFTQSQIKHMWSIIYRLYS